MLCKNWVPSWRWAEKLVKIYFFSGRSFGQSPSSAPRIHPAAAAVRLQELTRTATVTVPLPERKGSTRSKNLKGS